MLAAASAGEAGAQTASVNLGAPSDVLSGLANTRRANGTDGENATLNCGPMTDLRSARRPLGATDGDLPDHYLYINVTSSTVKSSAVLTITAVVFDGAADAGSSVFLQYTTSRADTASDFREVFFLHEHQPVLPGTGGWATLTWVVRDAGFRTFMHSEADFRFFSRSPGGSFTRLCFDSVSASVGAPAAPACPSGLAASVDDGTGSVLLSWTNGETYDRIAIARNGSRIAVLAGSLSSFEDSVPPGRYRYDVVATKAGQSCIASRLSALARVFPAVSRCACPNPDLNLDGEIDLQDLAIAASNLDLDPSDPRFTIDGDADRDGAITMDDVLLVLEHLRGPPPFPAVERRLDPLETLGGFDDAGPMVLITNPRALGSGNVQEDSASLLHHGRLLVAAGSGAGEEIVEVDTTTGATATFADASRLDANGDPLIAGVTGLSFAGPAVAVANGVADDPDRLHPVGSFSRIDPRSGNAASGAATGVFVGDEDAVDGAIGTGTARASGGFLSNTGGVAEGGPGPGGPEASPLNRVFFHGNWESDGFSRRGTITAADLDTGLYEVAAIDAASEGIPGPVAFVPGPELPASLTAPVTVSLAAGQGTIANAGPPPENAGISFAGGELHMEDAGPEDSVVFTIPAGLIPAAGDYVVRVSGRLPPGALWTRLRVEAEGSGGAIERRLRRGVLPGKLDASPRVVPLGRIALRAGASEVLRLSALEPGLIFDSFAIEGPVGGRIFAATRDPGSIRVYGLALGAAPTRYRGILERIIGVCEIEAGRAAEAVIDPIAIEVMDAAGAPKLLLLDSLRKTVTRFSLEGDLERCVHVPIEGSFLAGMASGPGGADGLPSLFLSARNSGAAGGGAAAGAAVAAPPGPSSTVEMVLDIDEIRFDREASGIVQPLRIRDRRDLVLEALFSDGSTREITRLATYRNIHPGVVELTGTASIRARRSAGYADIVASFQGLEAETRILVSAEGVPFREHRAVAFDATPPLGRSVVVYPNPAALEAAFGADVTRLRMPLGYRQWFTAVEVDDRGRALGVPSPAWTVSSAAGNSISADGLFSANASENPSEVGIDPGGAGLSVRAAVGGPRGSLESAPVPAGVYQPVEIPGAPLRALRIFPRDPRVVPGSTIRFVAVLVDEDGYLRNIEPRAGDPDPVLPGALWSSDGLPIDPRTGLFSALYAGETADEVSTVTAHDPSTGLSDSVDVTVLYSETNGFRSYSAAQVSKLSEELLEGELGKLMLEAHERHLHTIEVSRDGGNVAERLVQRDFEGLIDDLDVILFDIGGSFELDWLGEMVFDLDGQPRFEVAADSIEVRIRLRVSDFVRAQLQGFEVEMKMGTLPAYGLDFCNWASAMVCDPPVEVCEKVKSLKLAANERPVLQNEVTNDLGEVLDSRLEIVTRLDLATGDFPTNFDSAAWRTRSLEEVSSYLAKTFVRVSNLRPQLQTVRIALLEVLFGEDEGDCELNLKKNLLQPLMQPVCGLVSGVLAAFGIDPGSFTNDCASVLANILEAGIRAVVKAIFDKLDSEIEEFLADALEEQVIEPIEEFIYREIRRSGVLREVELGFEALAGIDDLGRIGSLRFAGTSVADPVLSLSTPPIGAFESVLLYFDTEQAVFRHDLSYAHALFPQHASLDARGRAGIPSGNPREPANGPARGNLGVASRGDDILSDLLRYGASTSYRNGGVLRGAVLLGTSSAGGGGDSVSLAVRSSSAPRLVLDEGAPGQLRGRVEQLLIVEAAGTIEYTTSVVLEAPLVIVPSGRRVTVDIPAATPTIRAPAPGEVPFAAEVRALAASSVPDLRALITGTLGARLPASIEYPARVGSRPGLGGFDVELRGADTDEALEDDILNAVFVEEPPGGGAGARAAGAPDARAARFRRGDCNDDSRVDVADAARIARFLGGEADIACEDACDADADGRIGSTDAVRLLRWLFGGGPEPPAPFRACGEAALRCEGGGRACP